MEAVQTGIVIIILAVAAVEMKRGFGRALFDLVGAIVVVVLARSLASTLAPTVSLLANKGANEALWLGIVFAVLGTAAFFLARWCYNATLISLDAFDPFFGAVIGLATGVAVAHVVLVVMLMGSTPAKAQQLRQTRVCRECVNFESYNGLVTTLNQLGR